VPGPPISWVYDILRASVICETEEEMVQVGGDSGHPHDYWRQNPRHTSAKIAYVTVQCLNSHARRGEPRPLSSSVSQLIDASFPRSLWIASRRTQSYAL
jgi:hypothetical protein